MVFLATSMVAGLVEIQYIARFQPKPIPNPYWNGNLPLTCNGAFHGLKVRNTWCGVKGCRPEFEWAEMLPAKRKLTL